MANKALKAVVVGAGNMGASHARAYHKLHGFELSGIVAPTPARRSKLARELGGVPEFENLDDALSTIKPDAVAVCSYPDTHKLYAVKSLEAGAHVFVEKPLAETVEDARTIVEAAQKTNRKVVVGYILRQHPAWQKFTEIARTLGKPLVMRMNLNQQSSGKEWETHKHLLKSMSPIVDCGVHYVDVMCQMTRSKPVRVQAIGARLTDEIKPDMYNYGQLQVVFEDGSVGWYEAGWGPMMSETAFFVKDVVGPKGCVSIMDPKTMGKTDSSDIDAHTKTNSLLIHYAERDANGNFTRPDEIIDTSDEPDHQELCDREQAFFLKAILEDLDLTDHLEDAVNSLRIVLAADESVRSGKTVELD
ncbi:MAG: Gfo/Idh/MocA family oxidoreductase [Calditrichaeota bacterium]|nr:Gfo/Idh/MocA family oxidoreductase [Calditrichota bacterium]